MNAKKIVLSTNFSECKYRHLSAIGPNSKIIGRLYGMTSVDWLDRTEKDHLIIIRGFDEAKLSFLDVDSRKKIDHVSSCVLGAFNNMASAHRALMGARWGLVLSGITHVHIEVKLFGIRCKELERTYNISGHFKSNSDQVKSSYVDSISERGKLDGYIEEVAFAGFLPKSHKIVFYNNKNIIIKRPNDLKLYSSFFL